jgi:tyrosyl-tRNA synthetase
MDSILQEFGRRSLIQDVSHVDDLSQVLVNPTTIYCGFDATADSLHIGNLLPLITIKRFVERGHKAIILIGTATAMIGDPSGKSQERNLLDTQTIQNNCLKLEKQISSFFNDSKNINILKNDEWSNKISFLTFLRDVGKHFSVNSMMNKESVKNRLNEREQGISFTEFSYMLLQANDFLELNEKYGCQLQIGGSDQWGNITCGIDLIKKKNGSRVYGLTFPLLLNSSGSKFGKTEDGNIWLSGNKTSPLSFHNFWTNVADDMIEKLLLFFSLESVETISYILEEHKRSPEKRIAQNFLADELTILIHGNENLERIKKAKDILFGGCFDNGSYVLSSLENEIPTFSVRSGNLDLKTLLCDFGIFKSKSEVRKSIVNGGIYLNNKMICDDNYIVTIDDFVDNKVLLLRTGKKKHFLFKLVGVEND